VEKDDKLSTREMSVKEKFLKATSHEFFFQNLAFISLLVVSIGTLVTSYWNLVYSETISFNVVDGWCTPRLNGAGRHCFGDYYAPVSIASTAQPWSNSLGLAYSPFNFSYFRILSFLSKTSLGPHFGMLLNLMLTILALSTPSIHILRQKKSPLHKQWKWVLLVCLCASPSLMMIDRGSTSFLLFPLLYFLYIFLQNRKLRESSIIFILLVLWKPQTMILFPVLLTVFGVKQVIRIVIFSILSLISSFVAYPTTILENMRQWFLNSSQYNNYQPIPLPGNYSLINFLAFMRNGFAWLFNPKLPFTKSMGVKLDPGLVSIFSLIFTVLVVSLLLLNARQISLERMMTYSITFLIVTPGTTFGYYLTLLIIPSLIINGDIEITYGGLAKIERSLKLFLVLLIIPAWPITWKLTHLNFPTSFDSVGVQGLFINTTLSLYALVHLICMTGRINQKLISVVNNRT